MKKCLCLREALKDYYAQSIVVNSYDKQSICNTQFSRSKNYLDRNLDCNSYSDLDHDPEDVPVYTGHSLFNTTK